MFQSSDGHAFLNEFPRHVLPWALVALFCALSGCYLTHEREAPVVEEVPPEPPVACDGRPMVCPTEEGCAAYVRELCEVCGSLPPVSIDVSGVSREARDRGGLPNFWIPQGFLVRLRDRTLVTLLSGSELGVSVVVAFDAFGGVLETSEPVQGVTVATHGPQLGPAGDERGGAVLVDRASRAFQIRADGVRGEELLNWPPWLSFDGGDGGLRIEGGRGQFIDFYGQPEGPPFEVVEPIEYACTPVALDDDDGPRRHTALTFALRRTRSGGFILGCVDRSRVYTARVFDAEGRRLGEWTRDLGGEVLPYAYASYHDWWDESPRAAQRLFVSQCPGSDCPFAMVEVDAMGFPVAAGLTPFRLSFGDIEGMTSLSNVHSGDELAALFADGLRGRVELRRTGRDGRPLPVVSTELDEHHLESGVEIFRDRAGYFILYNAQPDTGVYIFHPAHQRLCTPD